MCAESTTSCGCTVDVAQAFDEIGAQSKERHFPRFTEKELAQATPSGGQSGLGCKRAEDVAHPAHLSSLVAAGLRARCGIRCRSSQLVSQQSFLTVVIAQATDACVQGLDGSTATTLPPARQNLVQTATHGVGIQRCVAATFQHLQKSTTSGYTTCMDVPGRPDSTRLRSQRLKTSGEKMLRRI